MSLIVPDWPLPAGVRLGWTDRRGGASEAPFDTFNLARHVGDRPGAVTENRARLLADMTGASEIRWLSQVHSAIAIEAESVDNGVEADAAWTRTPGLACGVMTADCLPVFFWQRDGRQVAVAHAGWRGLANGVLAETLASFESPEAVACGLGPAIGPAAFEVGADVLEAFRDWPGAEACFEAGNRDGKWLADLPELAACWLRKAGVAEVYESGECTFSLAERYFSYRRDGVTGRMANVIWVDVSG